MLELLAPAGNFERFETGLLYGADAFYLAGKSFGLRAFAGNFTNEEILLAEKIKQKVLQKNPEFKIDPERTKFFCTNKGH